MRCVSSEVRKAIISALAALFLLGSAAPAEVRLPRPRAKQEAVARSTPQQSAASRQRPSKKPPLIRRLVI